MQARRTAGAIGIGLALVVLSAGPAWSEEPEPLPEGCSYVDAPGSGDEGTVDPAPEESVTAEPAPDPSAGEDPPVEEPPVEEPSGEPTGDPEPEPTDLPTEEPTGEPVPEPTGSDEPALGEGQLVVCAAGSQALDGYTGGGGGIETVATPAQLPATGSSTGSAALLGLVLVAGGTAVVLAARTSRRV